MTPQIARRRGRALLAALAVMYSGPGHAETPVTDLNIAIGISPEGLTCVLGGAVSGRITDASSLISRLRHKQEYTLSRIGRTGPEVWAIGAPQPVSGEEECTGVYEQELSLDPRDPGALQTALSGNTQMVTGRVPEHVQELPLKGSAHEAEIRHVLVQRGFPYRPVKLTQLIKTDLDGDGLDDVVINATDTDRETARRGEYSVLLIKPGDGGAAVPLSAEITEEGGDFPSLLWENTVVSLTDLDGNGTMELIVYGSFYYGDGWQVFDFRGGKAEVVLTCGCSG